MRSTKGEQTRAAIAEAALRMFREQGYEATTMRAIAKEVGVPEDLPAHRFDRAARRAPDRAGPGARGAVADPAAATGRRRRAVLTRRLRPRARGPRAGPNGLAPASRSGRTGR
ncbi:MAG TPA: helix-turn-helix domain-containing protein [Streptosporangiaceae bacterium]|nr:helix-turn-helix domain-containing protein [Streptosporangiaceae bacterium]